jgi:hypothetical protein
MAAKAAGPLRRVKISPDKRQNLISLMLRRQELFRSLIGVVPFQQMKDSFPEYELLLLIANQYFEQYGELPPREILRSEVASAVEMGGEAVTEHVMESIESILEFTFSEQKFSTKKLATGQFDQWAMTIGRQWFHELTAAEASTWAHGASVIADMNGHVAAFQDRLHKIDVATVASPGVLFPEGWDMHMGVKKWPTGVSFIDKFLAGGQAGGEVYAFAGPYGSCKTMLSLQMLVNAACAFRDMEEADGWDGVRRIAVYVTYETDEKEVQLRTLLYGAQVPMKTLETMFKNGGIASLSTSKSLLPYERDKYANAIAAGRFVAGERERVEAVTKLLNNHLLVIDLTGQRKEYRNCGNTVQDVAVLVERAISRMPVESKAEMLTLDYAGLMAKRQIRTGSDDPSRMRHLIGNVPLDMRDFIAVPMDCACWAVHQLNTSANKKSAGARISRTEFAECGSFLENVAFGLVVGMPNRQMLARFSSLKHRRNGEEDDVVVRIRGAEGIVEECGEYVLDANTSSIVPKKDAAVVGVLGVPAKAGKSPDISSEIAED